MNLQTFKDLFYDRRTILLAFVIGAIFTSVQLILLGPHLFVMPKATNIPHDIMNQPQYMNLYVGRYLTEYNNYAIFKYSWFHLLQGTDLYTIYPTQHWDFYKYSPTFALFMGSLAYLPDVIGLSFWNLLNALTVYFAIRMLPFGHKTQMLLLWFVFNELLTCLSNTQSNGLMCGLIIAAYACMEQRRMLLAALWLVLATYIKVYGLIGCCLFLFYPQKLRFIAGMVLFTMLFAALPLLVTPFSTLIWQYHNWAALMVADASAATGLSVNGLLSSWFGIDNAARWVTIIGMLLFLLPLVRYRLYSSPVYKLLMLASMLIWVIIFNHKAESPTFIIAVAGVGIWYFAQPATRWRTALLLFVLIFTSFSSTDFFPPYVRSHFMQPYKIKVFPCILAWVAVMADLLTMKATDPQPKEIQIV